MAMEIRRITVIGAGTMGHGIAGQAALSGFEVILNDLDPGRTGAGQAAIHRSWGTGVEKGKVTEAQAAEAAGRLTTSTDLEAAVADADLIIEAVPESLELKRAIFARVDAVAPAGALLATNTSSLPVTEIAAATKRPAQVVGMHFFNPVAVMKLLELVRGEHTSDATVEAARALGAALGKETILVIDSPGFATSRLGIALGNEAMRMFEEGVASAADIDTAMTLGYRHPIGPLALTDLVGLDVRLAITEHLYRELGTDTFRPPRILKRMVRAGKLGRKSGEGFYRY
ncbi:MAG: 3-hydroxyacyl-CoA dehydrogenase family protein [Myxococcales bacterium]|nr:3-hydroxyacyl-CoA dehydrogenase family protein [Myxococcales bacterium]MCB9545804.1 3-hydroxyacyl-CoA dehydrogenase family protein [Myxococcales bacterium]